MKTTFFTLLVLSSLLIFGQHHLTNSGIIYGPKAAFQICAAEGWVVDNKSGVSQGLPCVLYLEESSWADSPVIMYARIASPEYSVLEEFVEFAYKQYKKGNPNFNREEIESIRVGEYEAKVYHYEDPLYKSFEATAYIQVPNAVCYIVYSTGNKKAFDQYLKAFNNTVSSFKYRPQFVNYSGESINKETLNKLCND